MQIKNQQLFLPALVLVILIIPVNFAQALLSCNVSASACTGSEVTVFKMEALSNSHSELNNQSNYTKRVCCSGPVGLGTSCSGSYVTVVKLYASANSHAEQNSQSNYTNSICLSVPASETINLAYQANNCAGYDTTIASISGTTNSHMGDASAYTTKICATVPESLTFSISDNSIGFGNASTASARYATGDTLGSATDSSDAHTISVSTNATNGYTMTINGATLDSGGSTIDAIGATATASSVGTEQFGLRFLINSGTGSASSPYTSSNWALDTASFPDEVASGLGDGIVTILGARYIVNISASTSKGSYSSTLTYAVTANF